jgi:hypothetical protein
VKKEEPIKKAIPKGRKKVKKTRTYEDAKGYLVVEEYSSTEEVPEKEMIKHEIPKLNNDSKKKVMVP